VMDQFEQKLIQGMLANGYTEEFARNLFRQIEGFGSYGFPESHAASFALLVYVSAWIKFHYPAAFLAAILNSQPMGFYGPSQLVSDARRDGVEVRPVDINKSDCDCTLELVMLKRGDSDDSEFHPVLKRAVSPPCEGGVRGGGDRLSFTPAPFAGQ